MHLCKPQSGARTMQDFWKIFRLPHLPYILELTKGQFPNEMKNIITVWERSIRTLMVLYPTL